MELLQLVMKFHRPVKRRVIPAPVVAGANDIGVEPIGNEEFVPITKERVWIRLGEY